MNAYLLIEKDKTIEPFGEHPRQCLIANKKLCDYQREVLVKLGINYNIASSVPDHNFREEYIVFGESIYFTSEFISRFIAESRKTGCATVCGLKKDITTMRTAVNLQDIQDRGEYVELNLRYFPQDYSSRGKTTVVLIGCDQLDCSVPAPYHMCGNTNGYSAPMTDVFAVQINHWVNLWSANILTVLANIARIRKMPKWKLAPWKIFWNLNTVGTNCHIHKTACVEASVIGNNVTIEAGAIVRASIIGDNAHIGNGVVVEESVIGDGCKILHGHILFSVFYPGTFSVAGFISASLTGKDVFIGANATLTDFRFDGKNVTVLNNNKKTDSGNLFLGACLGHKVYIGAQCVIAPGRAVPNNLRICRKDMFIGDNPDKENFQIEPF